MNGKLSVAFCLLAPGSASPEWLFYDIISSCFCRVFGSLLYLLIHLTYTCLILWLRLEKPDLGENVFLANKHLVPSYRILCWLILSLCWLILRLSNRHRIRLGFPASVAEGSQ
ncbi:hypothetical protein E4T43_04118 [Aureobasidium subglaciale]|nr:hypothetical protein E4T43_04118 [Aureobasidium subglaciale]